MDKVRAFLRVTWQQRFWVLSVVGTLAVLLCWMLAARKLQAEFKADQAAIEGHFTAMKAIVDKPVHGNTSVNAREHQEATKIAVNVKQLWQTLYDNQRKEVLYWPAVLGADFVQDIQKKKFGDTIGPDYRNRYLNYIKNQFDPLVDIVKAEKMEEGQTGGGGPEGRGEAFVPNALDPSQNEDYLVQWLDQGVLQTQKLTFQSAPTPWQIWVTQEDLWVYETLLKAINNTNKERGATRPDNTAIRIIEYLQVGQEAALASQTPGNILMPAGAVSPDGALGPEGAGREGMAGTAPQMYGPEGGGAAAGGESVDAALLMNRYVDAEGKPIPDGTTANAPGTEFRRLPIRMVLMMDPKWIPRIIVHCANAPLPIEVKRLRINPEQSGAGFSEMTAAGGGGRESMYAGRGPEGMGGGVPSQMMSATMPSGADLNGLAQVEIQGLVYIFNPPDSTVLTVPGGETSDQAPAANAVAAH